LKDGTSSRFLLLLGDRVLLRISVAEHVAEGVNKQQNNGEEPGERKADERCHAEVLRTR
jgi:hypothetical protein